MWEVELSNADRISIEQLRRLISERRSQRRCRSIALELMERTWHPIAPAARALFHTYNSTAQRTMKQTQCQWNKFKGMGAEKHVHLLKKERPWSSLRHKSLE